MDHLYMYLTRMVI